MQAGLSRSILLSRARATVPRPVHRMSSHLRASCVYAVLRRIDNESNGTRIPWTTSISARRSPRVRRRFSSFSRTQSAASTTSHDLSTSLHRPSPTRLTRTTIDRATKRTADRMSTRTGQDAGTVEARSVDIVTTTRTTTRLRTSPVRTRTRSSLSRRKARSARDECTLVVVH